MASAWKMTGAIYLTLGVGLLLFFGLAMGVGFYSGEVVLFAAECLPTAFIPGVILVVLGLKARRRTEELIEFASWVKSYRRISLAEVARKLGKTEFETDRILADVVDKGLVAGFVDRETDEFVLQAEIGREQYIAACPRCGASINRMFPLGETVLCPYCGGAILGPPAPQPAPPYPQYAPPYGPYGAPPQGPAPPPPR